MHVPFDLEADALHQVDRIRACVSAVRARIGGAVIPMMSDALDEWAAWALGQADRIDPVVSGSFLARPVESDH
jgi:hypothetical protein